MRNLRPSIVLLIVVLIPAAGNARDGRAIWDSRCEECHGDPEKFAGKFLWNIEGQLQGQHHIDDLDLFMNHHYIPDHEIETIHDMLLVMANSLTRYTTECGECHGDVREYVEQSFWVGKSGITTIETGMDVGEFLASHRNLTPEDATFYLKMFSRVAGKPL